MAMQLPLSRVLFSILGGFHRPSLQRGHCKINAAKPSTHETLATVPRASPLHDSVLRKSWPTEEACQRDSEGTKACCFGVMGLESMCMALVSPETDSSFLAYDLVLGVPAILLIAFLGWRLRPCLRKLQRSQSHLMVTYYSFLWLVALLNGLRSIVQLLEGFSQEHLAIWNVLWLLTRCGLVLLEVSVVVFLLQGYLSSGSEALVRTLVISGTYAFVESLVTAVVIFGFNVPLFFHGSTQDIELSWKKWGFWLAHAMLFLSVYASLLIVPLTRWRDRLPAKPSFYQYVLVLFGVNLFAFLGAAMLGVGAASGYCVYGVSNFVYYALYPPILYLTFLAEFFQNTESDLDLLLASEMKEAGVFENYDYDF